MNTDKIDIRYSYNWDNHAYECRIRCSKDASVKDVLEALTIFNISYRASDPTFFYLVEEQNVKE